jgi:uncharacterized protein (DUF1810 family)
VSTRLDRFRTAQENSGAGFDAALGELRAGAKRGHWIWYIFPQLDGLGTSAMSRNYAIRSVDEAAAYLRDPLLRSRLLAATTAVADQLHAPGRAVSLVDLFGSHVDVRKMVSSLTLFGGIARSQSARDPNVRPLADAAAAVLAAAKTQGFPACRYTLAQLGAVE